MKLFWITLAVLSAAAAESPTAADPLSEPWRWRRFPQLENLGIRCMAQGNDGTLWFGGTAGLAAYDGLNWQVYDSTAFDFNGQINAVLPTDSAVYISSHGGLWQLAEGKFQRIFPTAWPYWVEVSDMATVRNALYAATRFGILRYVRGQLTLYTLAEQEQAVKKLAPSAKVVFLPQRLAVREAWPEGAGFYAPSNLVTQMIVQGPAQQAGLLIGDYLPFFLSHPNFELFFLGSPSGSQAELQFLRSQNQPLQSVKIRSAAFSDSLNMCEVEMLCRDRHDRLWLNINGSLVYRVPVRPDGELDFHGAVVEKLPLDHPYSRKFAMHHAADGRYWMIADDPLIGVLTRKESDKAWKSIDLAKAGGSNQNLSIIESQDGIIWITGHSALHGFDGQSWRIYTSETTLLPHARLYGLFTKEKEFWLFGLASHVFRIDYGSETWHTFPEMLFQCRSPLSGDWFLRYDGIILQHHQGKWKIHHVLDTPMAAAVIRTGEVWVYGGDNGSAAAARFDGAAWQVYRFPELSACIDYRAFCERRDGSLWFGAGSDAFTDARQKGGMICFVKENGIWKPQHLAPPAVPKDVVNLAEDNEGCLWFSGWRLFRLDGNGVSPVNQPSELALPWIDAMLSDPQTGDLWISKGGTGLFQKTAAGWRLHTQADGLADNLVTAMLIDTLNHRLWAATPNGISAYDPALRQWKTTVLPPELVIGREGGTLRLTPDGRVWVNRAPRSWHKRYLQPFVEPRERIRCISYLPDRQAPETRIEMSNQRVPPSGNALISWSGEDVRRRTAGEELEFSTRLDGGPWSPFTQERQNVLIGLSPGRHTFEVRAQDRDFNIDPTPASIEFVVLPPIWRQPWFIALILAFLAVILIYEIRILRRNRRIHELDQLKLRLFTNISHELRTPLTLILGPLEKLRAARDRYDEATLQTFDLMHRNAVRLLTLVTQIMDFRKMEESTLRLEPSLGDLAQFIRRELETFAPYAAEKNIALQFKSEPASVWAEFDLDKMQKILQNLVGNALKFTPAGGSVSVTLRQQGEDVRLWVQDTGIGIPKAHLPRLFERYYQVYDKRAQANQGAGIGLALTRELVELHGGTISVDSELDKGTRFEIHLPIAATKESEAPYKESDDRPLVLVADDHADIRRFIAQELKEFRILQAEDGRLAFELALEHMPDAVIADVLMPNMDGLELTASLKQHELTSHIPVILLTARTSQQHQIEGLQIGADDYLTKPFQVEILRTKLHNLINIRRELRERYRREIWLKPQDIALTPRDEEFLNRAMAVIESHMDDENLNVGLFAQKLGMSVSSLHSKLKALTGQTCTEFINHQRMKRAATLMVQGKLSAKEAAFRVGFWDQAYFSRVFKKVFGQSPTQYTKSRPQLP